MSRLRENFKNVKERATEFFSLHPAVLVIVLSYIIAFANEAMSRRSIWGAVVFVFTRPFMFLCNMAIIAVFESLALLSKKRKFWLWLISILWFAVGLTNFILMFNRITPLSAKDIGLIRSVFPILPFYLGWGGIIACGIAVLALIIALIVAYFRVKKIKVNYTYSAITVLISTVLATLFIGVGIGTELIPGHFSSLPHAYNDHGFTLCFSISIFDVGIDKPDGYKENIGRIVSEIKDSVSKEERDPSLGTPNIIFVQLESFYDLSLLEGFEFSEDPNPVFTQLRENCTSGILTVPSIGAGTANTEFEIISGMALKYFGAGEYPYETILQKKTSESICYILKDYGYTTHAVHNYKANFYSRKTAYSRLGFDTFTSIEFMNGLEYNALTWAKDDVLLKYVMDSLAYSEGPDFIQCITVQGHGQYPVGSYKGESSERIDILSYPDGVNKHSYKYLANQIYETDRFIGDLIESVEALGEETVIVFYGDHVPNIGMEEDWVPDGMTLFDTEYVIWRSDGQKTDGKNLTAYQLSSEILAMYDLRGGIVPALHGMRDTLDEKTYSDYLHAIQYDVLYGDSVAYDGINPYSETDIKLGLTDITITDIYTHGEYTYVKGTGFTKSSQIFINDSFKDTEFIDDCTLILAEGTIRDGDKVNVIQIADYFFHISKSPDYTYTAPEE